MLHHYLIITPCLLIFFHRCCSNPHDLSVSASIIVPMVKIIVHISLYPHFSKYVNIHYILIMCDYIKFYPLYYVTLFLMLFPPFLLLSIKYSQGHPFGSPAPKSLKRPGSPDGHSFTRMQDFYHWIWGFIWWYLFELIYVCVFMYIRIYIYMCMCIYIYIHTYILGWFFWESNRLTCWILLMENLQRKPCFWSPNSIK